jgi:hypothetical protein
MSVRPESPERTLARRFADGSPSFFEVNALEHYQTRTRKPFIVNALRVS